MLPGAICGWILSPFPSILSVLWCRVLTAEWAACLASARLTPSKQGCGTLLPAQNSPWAQGTGTGLGPARGQALQGSYCAFEDTLVVCLSLGNREDGKNVNVILSPMSHRSARDAPVLPPPSERGETGKGPEAPQEQLPAALSACLAPL